MMKYRQEIDGLRALAVLPVVFFHAGFNFMNRGFLGVDIFFVISGFLITSIILDDLKAGKFSFSNFYDRRIRRILPILFFVCMVSTLIAFVMMLPDELDNYLGSLLASVLFYANFFFYSLLGGYFSADAELQPLLHIWSLAVEEQFYLIFPFLILCFYRFGKKTLLLTIGAVFLASFIFCLAFVHHNPMFAFFMLPTRFWELAAGGLLAISALDKKELSHKSLSWLSWFGLLLILYSLTLLPRKLDFPGWGTVPVILGTMLILGFARAQTSVGKILSWKPLVFIGLISYSLYLWHQPIFVFARLYIAPFQKQYFVILIIFTIILATLSWKFIEQPFRRPKTKYKSKAVFIYAAIGISALSITAIALPRLYAISPFKIDSPYSKIPEVRQSAIQCEQGPFTLSQCTYGSNPQVLLIGDSYAGHLIDALLTSKSQQPFAANFLLACPPLFNFADTAELPTQKEYCLQHQKDIKDVILQHKNLRYVIISTSLSYYLNNANMLTEQGYVKSSPLLVEQKFAEIIDWLSAHNIKTVLISPPARTSFDPNRCIKSVLRRTKTMDAKAMDMCSINYADISDQRNGVNALLDKLKDVLPIIHLDELMCEDGKCPVVYNGYPAYIDAIHLSPYGSAELGKKHDLFGKIIAAANSFGHYHFSR
ncbi:acyltransferase family protein [Bartonella sp. HY761]|uniref:acyltransferase family protein n=1 Tax=Bartonella sp. HY761 TaxID=2979330 RepID=UPI00220EB778|nr:acyltransferase family protein [Bartonella sp. HY761]UXN05971.1 acyltransferase [Bartonella sp. HY761]